MQNTYIKFIAFFAAVMLTLSYAMTAAAAASGTDIQPPAASGTDTQPSVSGTDTVNGGDVSKYDLITTTTAQDIASAMNLGWNLGDSLDSWARDLGYDDFHNSNAYQMVLRYDDDGDPCERSTSINVPFDENNKCTYKWTTGLITSDENAKLGDIGFEIWNLTVEEDTPVTIKVTKAILTRRTGIAYKLDELYGEHDIVISKYGTTAVLTKKFPPNLKRTYGITDGTLEISVELVDFPQKEFSKSAFFETLRNNPQTSFEMINKVKESGFNAVRIPVTFFNHTVSSTNVVDAGWLDRVQEVVDYCYYQDMYCILCMQNDGSTTGWLKVCASNSDAVRAQYAATWKQVAERFKDYDQRLLFQGANEPTDEGNHWDYPGDTAIAWMNDLNQLFVDTIRSTGGNNAYRSLVLAPYAGSYEQSIIDAFRLPRDSVSDRLMVAVNAYAPAEFVYVVDEQATSFTDLVEWNEAASAGELNAIFDSLSVRFVKQGVPVIIGQFCSADKGNTAARAAHAAYYTKAAAERGITCFWWDDGDLLERKALTWSFPEIVGSMVDSTSIHVRRVKVDGLDDQYYTGDAVIPSPVVTWTPENAEQAARWNVPTVGSSTDVYETVTLTEGIDYEYICFDNINKGEADIVITGLGRYSGVIELKFDIVDEPVIVDFLNVLAEDNPQLPFVVMISFPMLLALGGLAAYKTLKRRESERVRAVVDTAMAEELEARRREAEDMGYGSDAIYKGERSYDGNRDLRDYCERGEYD